jgi:hypothetical protein
LNREKNGLHDDTIFNSISEYEVFKSNHLDTIYIETIIGHCKIYTYEEYEMLEEHTHSTFFCRASYDPVKVGKKNIILTFKIILVRKCSNLLSTNGKRAAFAEHLSIQTNYT